MQYKRNGGCALKSNRRRAIALGALYFPGHTLRRFLSPPCMSRRGWGRRSLHEACLAETPPYTTPSPTIGRLRVSQTGAGVAGVKGRRLVLSRGTSPVFLPGYDVAAASLAGRPGTAWIAVHV